jgi:hypothetical protein
MDNRPAMGLALSAAGGVAMSSQFADFIAAVN